MKRNDNFSKLKPSYLFSDIKKRALDFQKKHPEKKLISLSIGDTSEPLFDLLSQSLSEKSLALSTREGYEGYGPEQGNQALRKTLKEALYPTKISEEEIFISDGAKCDLGRLQVLFGPKNNVALLNPSYPVYLDSSLLVGHEKPIFLPGVSSNHFFPFLDPKLSFDLLFFCSPNNPTGYAATRAELQNLIAYVRSKRAILIFDAAYSSFIQDPTLPRSIYEIEGSEEVAIEVGSFSKRVGFSGVRLGWTVVPKKLTYESGESLWEDWNRVMTTLFNGASIISQAGGMAALSPEGLLKTKKLIAIYMENARILKEALHKGGFTVYGGENAPYLWVDCKRDDTWAFFDDLLEKKGLITTPGEGFGVHGKGFVRISSLGKRADVEEAARRLSS